MNRKASKILGFASLAAFILAIPAGMLFPSFCKGIESLGTIYVNLLKLMIVPVLFSGIVSALADGRTDISGITLRTIIVFIVMFAASFILCSVLWVIIRPGVGAAFAETAWDGEVTAVTLSGFLTSLFPSNIVTAMSQNALLPVIIFAFVMGIAIRECGLRKLADVFGELSAAFNRMLSYVMYLTPVGVFALLCNTVANYGGRILGTAAVYIGCAYLGCLLITVSVMILPVSLYCGISPLTYLKRVYKIWLMTLTTCSSAATLPNTIKVCNEEFGVPESITNLVVPLGCTIHMCGGAVSFSLLAFFNMQMFGIRPDVGMLLLMFLTALLLNMGAPGIPGGGIVIGATYLSILGIPISFIGFYAGIYRLLDMAYTTMNVCGDITANVLINKMVGGDTGSGIENEEN